MGDDLAAHMVGLSLKDQEKNENIRNLLEDLPPVPSDAGSSANLKKTPDQERPMPLLA